jgi:hypothetical protein
MSFMTSVSAWLEIRTRLQRGQVTRGGVESKLAAIEVVSLCFHIQFRGIAHLTMWEAPT